MQRGFKGIFMLCMVGLMFGYVSRGQQGFKFHEVKFRQVLRLPVGSKEGQVFVKVQPNREVIVPKLLPPDAEGNFWIMGEAKGGIMRVNHLGQIVTILRLAGVYAWPSVNSSGYLAAYVRRNSNKEEVHIYSPKGQKIEAFSVNGCPQCGRRFGVMQGLDQRVRVWISFSSSDKVMEEDPQQTICTAAFDALGRLKCHVEGTWGVMGGKLYRLDDLVKGSYRSVLLLDTNTMKVSKISVPDGWDGFPIGIDSLKERIWYWAWSLDDTKKKGLLVFDKEGIVAILPRPYKFLGGEDGKKILSSEPVIGADGRLYVAQCTEEAFYIFEADMSFLKR